MLVDVDRDTLLIGTLAVETCGDETADEKLLVLSTTSPRYVVYGAAGAAGNGVVAMFRGTAETGPVKANSRMAMVDKITVLFTFMITSINPNLDRHML